MKPDDELLSPSVMRAAIDAALMVVPDEGKEASLAARHIEILDRIAAKTKESSDPEASRLGATAGVMSVMLRGPGKRSEVKPRPISYGESRARLTRALYVHHCL